MRTIEEIMLEMDAVQATIPELGAANSTSQVSFFRLLKKMWAQLVQYVEVSWEAARAEVELLLTQKRIGSTTWYVEIAKQFQFGDPLTVAGGRIEYEKIDATKQVVKQASCVEDPASGRLLMKVATLIGVPSDPILGELSAEQLTAFKAYLNEVKFAGVRIEVVSERGGQFRLTAQVEYDRQALAANGASLADPTKFPVEEAIYKYLKTIPFDAVLSWTALTDYMQRVAGVRDFVIKTSAINIYSTNTWIEFEREIVMPAGWLFFAPTASTLTYL